MHKVNIFWFRRDLRLEDNTALYQALKSENPVLPVFIFDKNILDDLEDKKDRRVEFIYQNINALQQKLNKINSSLKVFYDAPENVFPALIKEFAIEKVFTNHDYEPYAIQRDEAVKSFLKQQNIEFITAKDQAIFEKDEVLKVDGTPYTVFTPYSKKWKQKLAATEIKIYDTTKYSSNFYKSNFVIPSLKEIGFQKTGSGFPPSNVDEELIKHYGKTRNYPGKDGTSKLSVHLRFGTISIRKLLKLALINETFLNELIWRDFYFSILWHFPKVGHHKAFKEAYENIQWRNNEKEFKLWCAGNTGYPIVDAGMRQLNEIGFMHNRVRMITASFLCKHLLIDWRWGEAYFAQKLLDYDLSANNGGWQWASGSGCDSAPYFRIFNPYIQTKKFDPEFKYIKKWVPEFQEFTYPPPIIDHEFARKRCLEVYGKALAKQ